MSAYIDKRSNTWTLFTCFQFAVAASMMAGGIFFLAASFAAKDFYAMPAIILISTVAAITKAIRDGEESARLHNRFEDARSERLLAEVSDPDAA